MRRRFVAALMSLLACAGLLSVVCAGRVRASESDAPKQTRDERLDIRLRSFAPGARGSLSIVPSASGGQGRLTVSGLPVPQTLSARASRFVVWAVAAGGRVINLGELKTNASGNGSLDFASPASFEKYSLVVTAEENARAVGPTGAPVLSTRAGEVTALFPVKEVDRIKEVDRSVGRKSPVSVETGIGRNGRVESPGNASAEIDDALNAGPSQTIKLFGGRLTPGARGLARVAMRNGQAIVRGHFTGLPPASALGAGAYVLWARVPGGRTAYLGTLPEQNIDGRLVYMRAPAAGFSWFDLLATAEADKNAAYPSRRYVLSTIPSRRHPCKCKRRRPARQILGS